MPFKICNNALKKWSKFFLYSSVREIKVWILEYLTLVYLEYKQTIVIKK